MVCYFLVAGGRWPDQRWPDKWPADTPTPRDEGAGLSAPAPAAKEEQPPQPCLRLYQPAAPRGKRVRVARRFLRLLSAAAACRNGQEERNIEWRGRTGRGWL